MIINKNKLPEIYVEILRNDNTNFHDDRKFIKQIGDSSCMAKYHSSSVYWLRNEKTFRIKK